MAPRIIAVAGKKRSGKGTLCNFIASVHPYTQVAFAGALWDVLVAADPLIPDPYKAHLHYRLSWLNEIHGYEFCKTEFPEVRRLLQRLGTDGVRKYIGETTWMDIVERKLTENPDTNFLVNDLRFPNEADMIHKLGGIVVKLEREGTEGDGHISESVDNIKEDLLYVNNSAIEDLYQFGLDLLRR